jgi:hypothetical protein
MSSEGHGVKRYDTPRSNPFRNVGYDHVNRHMEVEFRNGRRYRYEEFPHNLHTKFINADSMGDFFHSNIRPYFKGIPLGPLKDSVDKDEEAT